VPNPRSAPYIPLQKATIHNAGLKVRRLFAEKGTSDTGIVLITS